MRPVVLLASTVVRIVHLLWLAVVRVADHPDEAAITTVGSSSSSEPFPITVQEVIFISVLVNWRAVRPAAWQPYDIDQSVST